jgi:hypothetical protein
MPAQAYLCDIAGVGIVVESQPSWFNIAISNVWFGTTTGNIMRIEVVDSSPPATNTPIVFLAATNLYFKANVVDPAYLICSWSFLTNRTACMASANYYTNAFGAWNLVGDKLSWFYVSEDNGATAAYASNLVYKARIQQSPEAVYEYLRTQANTNTTLSQKVWADARFTFINLARGSQNTFCKKMLDDPLLPTYIRNFATIFYKAEYPPD